MTGYLVVAGWLAGWALLWRTPRLPAAAAADDRAISVVVPARNEEATLPVLLSSLREQTRPPAEVIVVDDDSSDRTATVARAFGARVMPAPSPPPGWLGKPWACHIGTATARHDDLIFLDADVRLAPDALARLGAAAGRGLTSVQPYHEVVRVDEHASAIPNVVALMASGIAAFRRPRPRLAFGPCLATSRRDLDAVGGFEAVRDELLEDAALARRYVRHGLPVRCFAGRGPVRFRMYPAGGRSIVEGWTRTLAGGARIAPPATTAGAALWVAALVAVSVEIGRAPGPTVAVAWAAVTAQMWWLLRRVGSFRWWAAPAFPLLVVVFVALFASSVVQRSVRRQVRWRGRTVPVGSSS